MIETVRNIAVFNLWQFCWRIWLSIDPPSHSHSNTAIDNRKLSMFPQGKRHVTKLLTDVFTPGHHLDILLRTFVRKRSQFSLWPWNSEQNPSVFIERLNGLKNLDPSAFRKGFHDILDALRPTRLQPIHQWSLELTISWWWGVHSRSLEFSSANTSIWFQNSVLMLLEKE